MDTLAYVVVFSLIGGFFSLIGGALLLSKKSLSEKLAWYATPFAAGSLLAAVFLDLLKEGIHEGGGDALLISALAGVLLFFFAERFLHWFHHHHEEDESSKKVSKNLIIFGDTMHNALDGVAIAAAFLISIPTGIVTTLAVAAHEIPQEIGDFGLLLSKGMSRRRVLIVSIVSSLATTVAAVITYFLGSADKLPLEVLLGLSAGFLLYVAMSDIIPTIHHHADRKKLLNIQPILLLVGVIVVGLGIMFAHRYIDHGHEDHKTSSSQVEAGHADDHDEEENHSDEPHAD